MVHRPITLFLLVSVLLLIPSISLSQEVASEASTGQVKIGGSLEIPKDQEVDSAVAVGGSLNILGHVKHDAVAVGGSIHLGPNATIGGDAVSVGGKITKEPGATIGGDVVEVSPISISPVVPAFSWKEIAPLLIIIKMVTFLGFLGMALLAALLIPKQLGTIAFHAEENFIKSFAIGIFAFLLFLPIMILMIISIIGIIFIPIVLFIFLLAILLGYIAISQVIGKKVGQLLKNLHLSMMVEISIGLVILAILGLIPFVGLLVHSIVAAAGLGAVLATRFGTEIKS